MTDDRRRDGWAMRRLSQWELRQVLHHCPDSTLIVNPFGEIVFASRRVERTFGYAPEALVGRPVATLIPSRYREPHDRQLQDYFASPQPRHMCGQVELRALRSDGTEIPVEISLAAVGEDRHRIVIATIRDVSERHEALRTTRQLNDELEAKARELESLVGDLRIFAQTASHDLQAPIRQIRQFLQLVERRHSDQLSPEVREYIQLAIQCAVRMSAMVHDVLAYSRVGSAEPRFTAVDLAGALEDSLALIGLPVQEAGAHITHDPLPTVHADRAQMVQLFQNLVGNAISHRGDAPPEIHVSAVSGDREWTISVSDNGPGVDPAQRERVFEMFQRASGSRPAGTGVGLAICKRVIERHGGRIWVEPSSGGGARFSFTIPIREFAGAVGAPRTADLSGRPALEAASMSRG